VPSQLSPPALDRARREGGHVVEMQRRRLLLAFADVLAEDGLEAAGVGRVCKRAGVSRRTFYDLFDGREACFVAVVDHATERLSQRALPAYADRDDWRERIRAALAAVLHFFDSEPALARACVVETLKAGAEVAERRARVLGALATAVDEGRHDAAGDSAPPPLTAQSTVGGAISVLHARLLEAKPHPLTELLNPLMSMIVLPYLGGEAARRELERSAPRTVADRADRTPRQPGDPFKDLPIRITFRTARVLATIGAHPQASNRQIGAGAGVPDQGQISKLLRRLEGCGLIENRGQGQVKGEPNAWRLTERGHAVQHAIDTRAA
jgi:AcrR family transcriptional regulator/DNA-binding MarR family transcriptional regulator